MILLRFFLSFSYNFFLQICFSICLFYNDCQLCLSYRKKAFCKTLAGNICATWTVTGHPCFEHFSRKKATKNHRNLFSLKSNYYKKFPLMKPIFIQFFVVYSKFKQTKQLSRLIIWLGSIEQAHNSNYLGKTSLNFLLLSWFRANKTTKQAQCNRAGLFSCFVHSKLDSAKKHQTGFFPMETLKSFDLKLKNLSLFGCLFARNWAKQQKLWACLLVLFAQNDTKQQKIKSDFSLWKFLKAFDLVLERFLLGVRSFC